MSVLDEVIKRLENGTNVEVVTINGQHLRTLAQAINNLADEVDAGSKIHCCGAGVAFVPAAQEDGGVGAKLYVDLHFADVVNSNAPRH